MNEMKIRTTREVHVHATFEEGLVPDMLTQYTAQPGKFRPQNVSVDYYSDGVSTGQDLWVTRKVIVRGWNVKKDGTTGVMAKEWFTHSELGLPGWLTDLVRENKPTA